MPRVYVRKFDWDEARRLRAEGLTYQAIGERLGVTWQAVRLACDEAAREDSVRRSSQWQRTGVCPDCGVQVTRRSSGFPQPRCIPCSHKLSAISVREDTLKCSTCDEWKPDEDFPMNAGGRKMRRGRHAQCRVCLTIARRDHRRRNREADNAYNREHRRRKRLVA